MRGYCGLGNYKLKYLILKRPPSYVYFSRVRFTPNHLPVALQNTGKVKKMSRIKRDEITEFTHLAVAKTIIAQNKIKFAPQFDNVVVVRVLVTTKTTTFGCNVCILKKRPRATHK